MGIGLAQCCLMIETDELAAGSLPECLLEDTVTAGIPCKEVMAEKSACIA